MITVTNDKTGEQIKVSEDMAADVLLSLSGHGTTMYEKNLVATSNSMWNTYYLLKPILMPDWMNES